MYTPTNNFFPVSFLSCILPYKAILHAFCLSYVLSHWLHYYLDNYFTTKYT